MKKVYALVLSAFIALLAPAAYAQCPAGQTEYQVVIDPDDYPSEISWTLSANGTTIGTGGASGSTYCIPTGQCVNFTINDAAGDGICCGYGIGSYQVLENGIVVATGGNYGATETQLFGCPPGTYCQSPLTASAGVPYTAPTQGYWYTFTPTATGMYEITTCYPSNTCDTKIWVYDDCIGVFDATNAGTLYYDDDAGGCGIKAVVSGALSAGTTYIIRIGDDAGACGANPIDWQINYLGAITGCMDPLSCNYNPLATVAGPCYYYPSPLCPPGPDLLVVQSDFESSLSIGTTTSDVCAVTEGCLNGYGTRRIIEFTTHIKNIGATDYYIGNPSANPGQFNTTNCHGHTHYEGYAEYVLYDAAGNALPIGFKNGFCVMDLECSGGGTYQYGCGNMGISAGCGDIYGAGLSCQWIDITDVPNGDYTMAIKVNWDQSPDALGRYESDYTNNWGQVCINIYTDGTGQKNFTVYPTCAPYTDCAGTPYGNAVTDCNGICNGGTLMGDLDMSGDVLSNDAQAYVNGIVFGTMATTTCNDLSGDGFLSVWDAGLANNCALFGTPFNNECTFPNTIVNPSETVTLGILGINTSAQYIDIYIKNPDNKVVGYEFDLHDVQIASVQNLVNPTVYNITPAFLPGGNKVIGLSYIDSLIPKHVAASPLCRVYYNALGDSVCIQQIVHTLNDNYEATQTAIQDGCLYITGVDAPASPVVDFVMYPNPANDRLTVVTDVYTGKTYSIVVRNYLGQVMQTVTVPVSQRLTELDLSSLATGSYMVEVKAESFNRVQQLIVKR